MGPFLLIFVVCSFHMSGADRTYLQFMVYVFYFDVFSTNLSEYFQTYFVIDDDIDYLNLVVKVNLLGISLCQIMFFACIDQ